MKRIRKRKQAWRRSVSAVCVAAVLSLGAPAQGVALPAAAATASGTCGENLTWTLDEDGTLTIAGSGEMADYETLSPWEDYESTITSIVFDGAITSIGDYAFSSCDALTSLDLPDSVTSIGDYAFSGCGALATVSFGENVSHFGAGAFRETPWLSGLIDSDGFAVYEGVLLSFSGDATEVTIPDDVRSIADGAFMECYDVTSVHIGRNVQKIGGGVFQYCFNITSIEVDSGNAYYESIDNVLFDEAGQTILFYPSTKTAESYVIPAGVVRIEDWTFGDCSNLISISIPDGVTIIGDYAFDNCSSLTSVAIPDSVIEIGVGAFGNGIGVESSLRTVTIGENSRLQTIGDNAFMLCTRLEQITIPNSVTRIGNEAFGECYSLTDVYYIGTEAEWAAIEIGDYNEDLLEATIHYHPIATVGDLDGDSQITVQDASITLSYYAEISIGSAPDLTDEILAAADIDGDGQITVNDARYILVYYAETSIGGNPDWDEILGNLAG